MQDRPPSGDMYGRPQTRPFGSSGLAALLGIGVFLLALFIAGYLIFRDGDDESEFALSPGSPTPTSTLDGGSLLATPTAPPEASPVTEVTGTPDASTPDPASPTPRIFPTLTPTATTPPEDEDVAVTDPTTDPDEPVDEVPPVDPTDVPPADDPDPTVEEPPPAVEEPVAGDFGFLPPPQLPSGGASNQLSLDFQLATSLELVPSTGYVYEVVWPDYSESEVAAMAQAVGVNGEVVSQGDGVFHVSGEEGTLFVAPTIIEYGSYTAGSGGPLPSADVAINAAWTWFSALGLGGVPAGDSEIVAVEESAGLSVVSIVPSYPSPNLAPTPSARIKVSAEGVVEEATVVWPWALAESSYGLKPGLDVWEELRAGNAFISADLSESGGGAATMNVTDISIAYTVAGSPWDGQYLVPLVVFGGTAEVNGVSVWVTAYVPAVYHQGNPSG